MSHYDSGDSVRLSLYIHPHLTKETAAAEGENDHKKGGLVEDAHPAGTEGRAECHCCDRAIQNFFSLPHSLQEKKEEGSRFFFFLLFL